MNFFFFRKNNLSFFVLVNYLIPIIGSTRKTYFEGYNPTNEFTLLIQHKCFNTISQIFKDVPLPPLRENKKEFVQYAILYLRYVTDEERVAYNNNLPPGELSTNQYLLYEGEYGTIYNEEFAYSYYDHLAINFELLGPNYHPYAFCKRFPGEEKTCKQNMKKIIQFAFFNIVLYDIEHLKYVPKPYSIPLKKEFAVVYLHVLAKKIVTKRGTIKWPEEFCRKTYKKETPDDEYSL